jgi:hypothetical protein
MRPPPARALPRLPPSRWRLPPRPRRHMMHTTTTTGTMDTERQTRTTSQGTGSNPSLFSKVLEKHHESH